MRKIIFQMMTTVDGFFEGPNRELDWHVVDDEFSHYAIDLLNSVDTILFGRLTYQMMAEYWQSGKAAADDPVVHVEDALQGVPHQNVGGEQQVGPRQGARD